MTWTLDSQPVLSGLLTVPAQGAWRASLDVDAGGAPVAGQRVTITASGTVYSGTVRTATTDGGRSSLEVVAGAGGLRTTATVASYYQARGVQVAHDIALAAGETVELATQATLGALVLGHWSTLAVECGRAWQALADELGLSWWVTPAGELAMGQRASSAYSGAVVVISADDRIQLRVLALEACDLAPGQTVDGLTVDTVEYAVSQDGERATVYGRAQGAAMADATGPARDMARAARTWTARVAVSHADGTVDLVPDDDTLRGRGMQRVPVWLGIPGTVTVPVGSRVGLLFANGKASEPVAALYAGDGLTTLDIGSGAGGYIALASLVATELGALKTAIANAAVGSADGGALFKTNILAALTGWPGSVASGKVRSE